MFVTTDEPASTHPCHPKSIVYIMIHSRLHTLYEFGQMCNDMYTSLWCHTGYFHCPKSPLCPAYIFYQSLSLIPGNHWSPILSFPECLIVGIIQYLIFPEWLLSLNIYAFKVFSWPDSSFTLALVIRCFLSVHLLKDILTASKFWQLWVKLL